MRITLGPGVTVTRAQLETSPVFSDWAARLGPEWKGTITVTSVDFWDNEVHALQVTVTAEGDPWPSMLTLRSETVDVLVIVTDGNNDHIVFVEQYRSAAGAQVTSNVAGGLEGAEAPLTAAARELKEELGLEGAFDIHYVLLLPRPVLATPGLTNERVHMAKAEIKLPPNELEAFLGQLQHKQAGVEAEGEHILMHVVPAEQARRFIMSQPCPDGKTLLSLGLAGL